MNSPENCLILIIFVRLLCQIDSFPIDEKFKSIIKPCVALQKNPDEYSEIKSLANPEELGPYFEGDIIEPLFRQVRLPPKKWINRTIPYQIWNTFSPTQKNTLMKAIEEVNAKTCINLIPRTNQGDFLIFKNDPTGCWSSIGRTGGPQVVNLEDMCLKVFGTGIHEIFHSIGLYHEQNRIDRDDFVDVKTENIVTSKLINFRKTDPNVYNTNGVLYDYGSVMHYSAFSFSKNGKITIDTKGEPSTKSIMGQRKGMSERDIEKIKRMYNC